MIENPCLLPACLSDAAWIEITISSYAIYAKMHPRGWEGLKAGAALEALYDAEWRKRGFHRSA